MFEDELAHTTLLWFVQTSMFEKMPFLILKYAGAYPSSMRQVVSPQKGLFSSTIMPYIFEVFFWRIPRHSILRFRKQFEAISH